MIEFFIRPEEGALAKAMRLDRTFFEQHPDKMEYCRLAIPGEDFGFFPPKTLVHVINCGKGARLRAFHRPPQDIWADLERGLSL